MNYQETVHWMFNQLPIYQLQGASAYKKDLTNANLLADYLGNPEKNIKFIHVAGTNGKGSTSHMLASILQEAGYKTGLYTSPHLKDFRERIKIDGREISENFVQQFTTKHKVFFETNDLSFFEMSVGLAFDYFKTERVDIAVIEVGLGGRLDATNIITPLLSVITNIGLDHTQILGNTLEAIAAEKAGIIKPGIPVIVGEYTPETKPVFIAKAVANHSPIFFASDLTIGNYQSALLGNYQIYNTKTVVETVKVLQSQKEFNLTENNICNGLQNVVTNTGLMGRWQQLRESPKVICDTAHNIEGLKIVIKQILESQFDQLHIVLGFVNDKDLNDILPLFPKTAQYYFCKPNISRGLNVAILHAKAISFALIGTPYNSVSEAYHAALENAATTDFIFVGGSTFVVAEIL